MALRRSQVVAFEGAKELAASLSELTKATQRNVIKRILLGAGEPMAADAAASAPVRKGRLRVSIGVGTKLSRRQSSIARADRGTTAKRVGGAFKSAASKLVEVYVGAGPVREAVPQEFGTFAHPPHPFMRPAWDANKMTALEYIKSNLGAEIERAAARARAKSARIIRKVKTGA